MAIQLISFPLLGEEVTLNLTLRLLLYLTNVIVSVILPNQFLIISHTHIFPIA